MSFPIATPEEFYAHAIAIEREASERYTEFEAHFVSRGQEVFAALCHNLAALERSHLADLLDASRSLTLPAIRADLHHWLAAGPPEPVARELFYRVVSERELLLAALHAEQHALAFFEWIANGAQTREVRHLARAMANEEAEHVRWVVSALEYLPRPPEDPD